jgi:hypothetical protein
VRSLVCAFRSSWLRGQRLTDAASSVDSDPEWSGGSRGAPGERAQPSHAWTRPSFWKPVATTVDNMLRLDFENPSLDRKLNLSDRSNVRLIDRVLIPKRPSAQPSTA